MRRSQSFIIAGVLSLCTCGDRPIGADDGDAGPVGEGFDGYCMITFTEDHEIYAEDFGRTVLSVAKGDRFLLTNRPFAPAIVILHESSAIKLDIDAAGLAKLESPCLDEDATLSSDMVAIVDIDVYADDSFEQVVCTIEQYERAATDALSFEWDGGDAYNAAFNGAYCGDLSTGVVRFAPISLGGVDYGGVAIHELFWRRD